MTINSGAMMVTPKTLKRTGLLPGEEYFGLRLRTGS
jgi:hypothetical protein